MSRRTSLLAVIALVAAPLIVVWRCLFLGYAIGPFDQIQALAPWNGSTPSQPWDVLQADGVLQFYPWRSLVFEAWSHFQVPSWNPYSFAGAPLLANSQSAGFYPPHIILGLLHVPVALGMAILAWGHLALAGVGLFRLVKSYGGSNTGAVTAGLSFALSPFMLSWTALPSVITTVAWIPWLLLAIRSLCTGQNRSWLGVAAAVGMIFLAGHLQFAAYGMLAGLLFAIATLAVERGVEIPRRVGLGVLAVGVGMAFAGAQLVPVLLYSRQSHRRVNPSEEGYHEYLGLTLSPTDVVSRIANPMAQGDPTEYVAPNTPFSQFWPTISRPGANYAESAITVGPIVVLLLGLFAARRPKLAEWVPLTAVTALSLLVALGTPVNRLLYFVVPGWAATGSPARIEVLAVMGLCALAGLGIPRDLNLSRRSLGIALGAGFFVCLLGVVAMVDAAPAGISAENWQAISGAAATGAPKYLVGLLLSTAVLYAAVTKREVAKYAVPAAVVLLTAVLGVTGLVRTGDTSFLTKNPLSVSPQERIAIINDQWSIIGVPHALMPPNLSVAGRVHEVAGYDSLVSGTTKHWLEGIDGGDPAPPANGNMMFVKSGANVKYLAAAGVSQIWSLKALGLPGEQLVGNVYVSPVSGTRADAGVTIEEDSQSRKVLVSATPRAVYTLRDRLGSGWSVAGAEGASARMNAAKGGFGVEIHLGAPTQRLVLEYSAPGSRIGIMMTILASLVGIISAISATKRLVTPSLISESSETDAAL